MLNLLPQQEKAQLTKEYRIRMAIIITAFVCILLLIASVGLFPTYISARAEINEVMKQKETIDIEAEQQKRAEAEANMVTNKALADFLDAQIQSLSSRPQLSEIISKLVMQTGDTVTISGLTLDANSLVITGVAQTRNDLINFHNTLRSTKEFKAAVLPISDIAKRSNAEFSIQITLQ